MISSRMLASLLAILLFFADFVQSESPALLPLDSSGMGIEDALPFRQTNLNKGHEVIRARILFGTTTATRFSTTTTTVPTRCIQDIQNDVACRKKKRLRIDMKRNGTDYFKELQSSQNLDSEDKPSHRDFRLISQVTIFTTLTLTSTTSNTAVTASVSLECTPIRVNLMFCS